MNPQYTVHYEDKFIVIVDKVSGLPTQALANKKQDNLFDIMRSSKRWSYVGLHHRLDVATSGLVLLTINPEANKGVTDLFRDRKIQKTYACVGIGDVTPPSQFQIRNYLKAQKSKTGKTLMRAVKSGEDLAETDFKTLQQLSSNRYLIQAEPHTGRMHQIRVHLADYGLPIVGDTLYGRKKAPRLMLHAQRLRFLHPITNQEIIVESAIPEIFFQVPKL